MSDEEDVPAWDGPIIRPKAQNGSSSAKSSRGKQKRTINFFLKLFLQGFILIDHRHSRQDDRHKSYQSRNDRDRSKRGWLIFFLQEG
jgi:hypothetical protein